jgi:hypothetical protein
VLKKKYRREMDYVYAVINEMDRKLERPIRDLDDIRMVMDALKKIREQEVDMELKIDPIEVHLCLFNSIQFNSILFMIHKFNYRLTP